VGGGLAVAQKFKVRRNAPFIKKKFLMFSPEGPRKMLLRAALWLSTGLTGVLHACALAKNLHCQLWPRRNSSLIAYSLPTSYSSFLGAVADPPWTFFSKYGSRVPALLPPKFASCEAVRSALLATARLFVYLSFFSIF